MQKIEKAEPKEDKVEKRQSICSDFIDSRQRKKGSREREPKYGYSITKA